MRWASRLRPARGISAVCARAYLPAALPRSLPGGATGLGGIVGTASSPPASSGTGGGALWPGQTFGGMTLGKGGLTGSLKNLKSFFGFGDDKLVNLGGGRGASGGWIGQYGSFGDKLQALGKSDAAMMGGAMLAFNGLQRGGWTGMGEDVAGGAMIGYKFGGPLGAAIGASIGLEAGIVRMFIKGAVEKAEGEDQGALRRRYPRQGRVEPDRPDGQIGLRREPRHGHPLAADPRPDPVVRHDDRPEDFGNARSSDAPVARGKGRVALPIAAVQQRHGAFGLGRTAVAQQHRRRLDFERKRDGRHPASDRLDVADPQKVREALSALDVSKGYAAMAPGGKVKVGPDGKNIYGHPVGVQWQNGDLASVFPDEDKRAPLLKT